MITWSAFAAFRAISFTTRKAIIISYATTFFIYCINAFIFFFFFKFDYITEEWNKYGLNPVLGDNKTKTLFDPFVFKEDDLYKMYVSWRIKGAIAISTSKNGINWSELKIILSSGNVTSWEKIVNRASVVVYNKKYYLWYIVSSK